MTQPQRIICAMAAVIACVGFKGGVGKSTCAVHLAGRAAALNESVVVADVDPQHHAASWLESAAPEIHCERMADTEEFLKMIQPLKDRADAGTRDGANNGLVICDLAGGDVAGMRLAMLKANTIVMPVGSSLLDLDSLHTTCETLQTARDILGTRSPQAVILPSRMAPTKVSTEVLRACEDIAAEMNAILITPGIAQRAAIADAAGQAEFVWNLAGAGDAAEMMERACNQIIETLGLHLGHTY